MEMGEDAASSGRRDSSPAWPPGVLLLLLLLGNPLSDIAKNIVSSSRLVLSESLASILTQPTHKTRKPTFAENAAVAISGVDLLRIRNGPDHRDPESHSSGVPGGRSWRAKGCWRKREGSRTRSAEDHGLLGFLADRKIRGAPLSTPFIDYAHR